jgi:tripartite-type tricarboxylate transporter receptor subunit TctC
MVVSFCRAIRRLAAAVALVLAGNAAAGTQADPVASFFAASTIKLITGGTAGGGYDQFLRLLAEDYGRHLPGNPRVIVELRTGAGGLNAVNYVYNAAPRDGTHLIMPYDLHAAFQMLQPDAVKFDMSKLFWIGNMTELSYVLVVNADAGVRSIDEAKRKEIILGASSRGTQTFMVPALFNRALGTKFKLILGYQGTTPMTLAMERREIQGHVGSWYNWKTTRPQWFRDGTAVILAQGGLKRSPELPDVPIYAELASTADEKAMMNFLAYPIAASRALAVPPGVPAERVAALRKGLMDTMADPAFLAKAKKRRMEITPGDHRVVEDAMTKLFATPPALLDRMRAIFNE